MILDRDLDLAEYIRKGFHRLTMDRLPLFPIAT